MMVRTDVDLVAEELSLPTPKPLGHFCTPIHDKDYALVSKRGGVISYFELIDFAVPIMRMLYLLRIKPQPAFDNEREPGALDFRLYMYDRKTCCWSVAIRSLEFPEGLLRKEAVCQG